MNVTYIKSALKPHDLPPEGLPEIAVVGRSNCGKSSFINALLNNKKLARHSQTPGRTQLIHFFNLDERLVFADLPGYGFARAPKATRRHWQDLVESYLNRRNLHRLVLLMDIRRNLDEEDKSLIAQMVARCPAGLLFVMTKSDKVNRNGAQKAVADLKKELTSLVPEPMVFAVSNLNKSGIEELRELLVGVSHSTGPG